MRQLWTGLAAVAAATFSSSASAREPLRFQPTSPWNVHYADDSCRLMREFGDGKSRVVLVLDLFEPGNYLRAMLVGEGLEKNGLTRFEKASLRFAPNEEPHDVTLVGGNSGESPVLFVQDSIRVVSLTAAQQATAESLTTRKYVPFDPPSDPAREAAVSSLELKFSRSRALMLLTGPMDKPLAALQKCAWSTVATWGLNAEEQKGLSRKPVGVSLPWLRSEDYPTQLLNRGDQGMLRVRLMIDASGKPTSCHIQQSTRPQEFDNTVCRLLMKRARFEPALNAKGAAVPSFWSQTIYFLIAG